VQYSTYISSLSKYFLAGEETLSLLAGISISIYCQVGRVDQFRAPVSAFRIPRTAVWRLDWLEGPCKAEGGCMYDPFLNPTNVINSPTDRVVYLMYIWCQPDLCLSLYLIFK